MPDPADPVDPFDAIKDHPFDEALSQRYLVYALSTITARSLPDLRDGLKPVHRRLLWAMRQLRMEPAGAAPDVLVANPARNSTPYKKCARVVGDVIGKYHPHGDASVYDAMVRLAQDFSLRTPLVEGQGNFGNIDGDGAAAMRYTECRLTQPAADLMAGLDEGTVDFKPTYNGEEEEPEVFPGLFPNLLANGSSGIAVGMATSIPPHNVGELIDAAHLLIDSPQASHEELMALVRGPDFPTGGLLVDGAATISEAYRTGRGSMRVRARFADEPEKGQGAGTWQLVVTQIPYQVQKGKLIEQIAQIIADKKLPILEDVRDESDEQLRIVLVPKSRNVDPEVLKESLYRLSDLETRFPLNLNVLDASHTPRVMGLGEVLTEWLKHQIDVLLRRARHRLDKIAARLELLDGFIIAYLNLDRVIQIIRTEDEPKPVMMEEFQLTDRQAEAILNMRLRSLRKLEEMELRREHDALLKEKDELEKLIESPARQRTRLKRDLSDLRKRYAADVRRTDLKEAGAPRDIPLEAMIEREPVTVILSQRGWIRAMKGHVDDATVAGVKYREGDGPWGRPLRIQTTDKMLLFASDGRVYTLGADKLPGGRGFGEPVRLMIDLANETEIIDLLPVRTGDKLILASSDGKGFVADAREIVAETRKGRQLVNLRTGARLHAVRAIPRAQGDVPGADHIAVIGDNRKLLVFAINELPEMTRGQGVTIQKYRDGGLSDVMAFRLADGLSWTMGGDSGRTRTESDLEPWRGHRGGTGRLPPNGFPRNNRFN